MTMAFEGVRIIDFTHLMLGPLGTEILADYGAEVIKIEPPHSGARGRQSIPSFNGVSCYFMALNRNKKSLSLNLKAAEAKQIVRRLVEVSDVVASNFRPGVMERLGFGYDQLRVINPRIICAYGSGFGRTGPYRDKQGQDLTAQAMGGLMSLGGERNGVPAAAGTFVADYIAGVFLALGISIALAARERTGEGQEVDACLLNAVLSLQIEEASAYLNGGTTFAPPLRGLGHSGFGPLYGNYQTKEGKWITVVGFMLGNAAWRAACEALNLPRDLAEDPRFQTQGGLAAHEAMLQSIVQEAIRRLTLEEAIRCLEEHDVLCCPVYDYAQVFSDPQVIHNEMVVETHHRVAGQVRLIGPPVKLSRTPGTVRFAAPTVGQHNEAILASLGYSELEIRELQTKGCVGSENLNSGSRGS